MSLYKGKHSAFILHLMKEKQSAEYIMTYSIRTNNYYWALGALYLFGSFDKIDKNEVVEFILKTQTTCGGFGGNVNQGAHIHTTLSTIQCLIYLDSFDRIIDSVDRISDWVCSLQNDDGSFKGDEWGEIDTKYAYCALTILSLLNRLNRVNVEKTVDWILKCQNFDGGFGCVPGCESHAGQILTALGVLSIAKALDRVDIDSIGFWLSERQDETTGGFDGRPEKMADVCYTWWVGASLAIINRKDWIDADKLEMFVLSAQNEENGGIADRPGNGADPFHTFLSCAGLSLFHRLDLPEMDPTYALPKELLEKHFKMFC